jgi:hypothetical protein
VIERKWESLAAMEAAFDAVFVDPDWQALDDEAVDIIVDAQIELLLPI